MGINVVIQLQVHKKPKEHSPLGMSKTKNIYLAIMVKFCYALHLKQGTWPMYLLLYNET